MRALYLKEKLVFEVKNIPTPIPKDDEVLIKVVPSYFKWVILL